LRTQKQGADHRVAALAPACALNQASRRGSGGQQKTRKVAYVGNEAK
jgi:hypothetical protein